MATVGGLFHADRKARALRQKLAPLLEQGLATLDIEPAVRADQLQRILRSRRPDVLHIVCHGSREGQERVLVLEDRRGQSDLLDAGELGKLVKEAGIRPELVILEACRSRALAEALAVRPEVGSTIGINDDIDPEASTRFFVSLLQALAWGTPVEEAFFDAHRDLELLAPSIWNLPVLFRDASRQHVGMHSTPAPASLELAASLDIDPTRAEEYVSLAEPLRPPAACFGREALLARLDDAWLHGTHRVVHLHGAAGSGKTALVAHWLDRQAQGRWQGATRVFTWSFDPLAEGQGCGSVAAFVERAQDFFGAVDPVVAGAADAPDKGEWLDGLRLGRTIRHERALLCLDAVPLLPHPAAAVHGSLELFPPLIGALLQELSRGRHALCILTTRSAAVLRMEGTLDEPVGALDDAAAAALLAQRGVVARRDELVRRGRELGGHPATLVTMAAVARALGEHGAAAPADVRGIIARSSHADRLLAGLAHGGGSLSFDELRALVGLPPDSTVVPAWDGFDDTLLQAVRSVCAVGIARVTDRCGVVLCESATLEHLPRSLPECAALEAKARQDLPLPLKERNDIPAHLHAVRLALRRGPEGAGDAARHYLEAVCRRVRLDRNTSYIVRELGAVADDLWFVAELFEPAADGSFRGEVLRAGVADADPPAGAFFHHRLGLALRHLGRLREAVGPLQRAYACYAAAESRFEERAATCANDLAETLAWQDDLEAALEAAVRAVGHADAAVAYAKGVQGDEKKEADRLAHLAQYLCVATWGYVHHRRQEHDHAERCFARAVECMDERPETDPRFRRLLSRPGYQYWCFLLGRLERRLTETHADAHRERWIVPQLEALSQHLDAATHWCESSGIARVTRAYHQIIKGRLMLLVVEHDLHDMLPRRGAVGMAKEGSEAPEEAEPSRRDAERLEEALRALLYATHVLRAHQHLWMLPEALQARARLFARMNEPAIAELDREEARELRAAFGAAG